MLNRLKVIICGKEYMLQTEEPPSYVYGLAKMLEKRLNDMCAGASSISPYSAAVMVALSSLDDLSKAQANVDEAGKARIERDAALKEIEVLKSKIEELESNQQLKKLKDSI